MGGPVEAEAFFREDFPLLQRLSSGISADEIKVLIFRHPRLLSEDRVAALQQYAWSSRDESAGIIRSNLDLLQKLQASLFQHVVCHEHGTTC